MLERAGVDVTLIARGANLAAPRELGIPTPFNQVVYAGLKPYANGVPIRSV